MPNPVATGVDAQIAAARGYLDNHREELLEFAAELVATPSPNPPGDESKVAQLAAERLEQLGASEVRVVGDSPVRSNVLASFSSSKPGPVVLLNAHLDTKPPGNASAWTTPPYDPCVRDGLLFGLGSADMKGAVAAIAYAAAATLEAQMSGEVNVVLSADEEAGSRHGSAWLASEGLLKGDVCVVAEPSGIRSEWEAIRVVSRGVAILTIHVRGTQMHSSLSDELPSVNANVVMARLMVFLHQRRKTIFSCPSHWLAADGPTFNVGLLTKGGLGYGILPGEAEFLCDVRALPGMTRESIERDLRAAIEDFRVEEPELDAHLELLVWTPPAEISQDNPIIRALESASADVLGRVPPLGVFPGGTDAPLFVGAGIPTVPSFGPGCLPRAHAPNEAVPLRSIVEAAHLYAVTAIRYAGLWQDLSDVQ